MQWLLLPDTTNTAKKLSFRSATSYIKKFETGGVEQLFNFNRKKIKKFEEPKYIKMVFKILHSPPSVYDFNRTTWRMEDLYQTLAKKGHSLSKPYIRQIIKNAGYRFLKAKKVLTSTDPQYREKLKKIQKTRTNFLFMGCCILACIKKII